MFFNEQVSKEYSLQGRRIVKSCCTHMTSFSQSIREPETEMNVTCYESPQASKRYIQLKYVVLF